MNLDPTQILILALLALVAADEIFKWVLILVLVRGQRAPSFPAIPSGPVVPPPVVVGPPAVVPPVQPPPVQPPIVVPSVVPPVILPPIVVPPIGVAIPRFTHITATSFAGTNDSTNSKTSAYTGKIIDSSRPGFALPKHLAAADQHRLIRAFWGGKTTDGPVEDVGPWYDGRAGWPIDPYWETGTRPRAETDNRTNHAGIDLTPGAWRALGHPDPEGAKDYISWDWVDALGTVAPSVSVPTIGPTQPTLPPAANIPAPVSGGTILQHNIWPKQSQAMAFFGNPSSAGWEAANLVSVQCPWQLMVEGTKSAHNTILIHRKGADSLTRVLNYIWNHPSVGKSQDKINEFGYNIFDGSYNYRPIAGTSTLSEHSYGGALDFNAAANPQHAPWSKTKFKPDSLIVYAFEQENWTWGGRWSSAYIDSMHFQCLET